MTLKWGAIALLSVFVLLAITWSISRVMYPTAEQREAVAAMKALPERSGENAFPLLWTLDRAVPENELEEVMAEDSRRASDGSLRYQSTQENGVTTLSTDRNSAAREFPDLTPSGEDSALFCNTRDRNCLADVRGDPESYAELIDRNRALLDRAERLHSFDYIRTPFPIEMGMPLPRYRPASYLRTRRALTFAQGRQEEAVSGICRDILTWRRLGKHSDSTNSRMVGIAYATNGNAHMLSQMLAEWPLQRSLPPPCSEALAPPTIDDVSLCEAMRSEFAYMDYGVSQLQEQARTGNILERSFVALFFDPEATLGVSAEAYASTCSQEERRRLAADEPLTETSEATNLIRFACVSNLTGCILSEIAWPNYQSYRLRLQDYGAKLRVLGTMAWMRRNAGDDPVPSELLESRPHDLKSPNRDIVFGPQGRTLQVKLYAPRRDEEHWSIPLPPALYREASG